MSITKLISGGQTGADRGGLDAALYCKVPHGGWCPKGRLSEDGTIPDKYDLQEMTTKDYLRRTEANVVDSDATVIFTYGLPSGGSLRTVEFARKHGKPYEEVNLLAVVRSRAVKNIVLWLSGKGENDYEDYEAIAPEACILNVAGSRESKAPDIELLVMQIMVDVLRVVNPECEGVYPLG